MHPADAPLRAAIAAAPDAALPRLVYADFLDDHDFPHHAASLRLDAALAAEKPWTDRYWQLLDDRRRHTPADGWPGDLGWLSDHQPLLCGVPDDWKSRWRAVRAFVSRWTGAPLGDVGRWGQEVEQAERTAGRPLPPSVKEWAAFLAEFTARPWYDELLAATGWGGLADGPLVDRVSDGVQVLYEDGWFGEAGEDVRVVYAIRSDDLAVADPPVGRTVVIDGVRQPSDWRAESVTEFVLAKFGRWESMDHHWNHSNVTPQQAETVAGRYPHRGRYGRLAVAEAPGAAAVVYPAELSEADGYRVENFASSRELLALGDPRTAR
jgi:uncharacterized protein (TIGR02996 family)